MKLSVHRRWMGLLKRDGELTVTAVIADAKNPKSPLHGEFEWDTEKAARKWLQLTARNLIKQVNVRIVRDEEKIVHVPVQIGCGEGTYKPAGVVVKDIDEFGRALSQALVKLRGAERDVGILQRLVAERGNDDRTSILAVALASISAAKDAVSKLH